MPSFSYLMYDWPFILAQAIEQAQSVDTTRVAEALRTTVYHGLFGEERFGMAGVYGLNSSLTRDIPMAVIKKGEPTPLEVITWPAGV
jgi:hypothetical protein